MRKIVDVGGGHTTLIMAILAVHPNLHGVNLDLPNVVPGVEAKINAAGIADRCGAVAGASLNRFPAERIATSWPTCSTTGTTSPRSLSSAIAAAPCLTALKFLSSNE
jgi:hypothetical protein